MAPINEAWRLNHIDLLLEVAMEKGVVDAELPHVPPLRHDEGEDDTNSALREISTLPCT
jgi:hypothetical protein